MAKKYRVVSQAAVLTGRDGREVLQSLMNMKLKPEQAKMLLERPVVIKSDLDNPRALQYMEQFSNAGLQVKIESYQQNTPPQTTPQDEIFTLLEETFREPIQPTTLSREYHKSTIVALMSAVIAPAIYASLVILVGLAIFWYMFYGHHQVFGGMLDHSRHGKEMMGWALALIAPSLSGGIILLFLLYPLWPRGRQPKPYILDRKKNPKLYRLTEQMAQAIGVPAPEFIELIPDVNAAAGPTKGMVSLMQGRLRLVIGLSLVAGCTVQQLVGILAHEYGHFSQKKSMLAYSWINRVTQWLSECAHGQDFWHHRLRGWMNHYNDIPAIYYTLLVTEYALQGVRLLFSNLLVLHVRMTRRMSQQMEFDADLYEARVVGSRQFRENSLALRKLACAAFNVNKLNFSALDQQDKLLKNIPQAVADFCQQYDDELQQKMEAGLQQEQTEYWDSHPADIERIDHAEKAREPGLLSCHLPARLLFNDFDRLCENSTMGEYHLYGIHGARNFITDNDQILN